MKTPVRYLPIPFPLILKMYRWCRACLVEVCVVVRENSENLLYYSYVSVVTIVGIK